MKKLIIITIIWLLLNIQLFSENTLIVTRGPVCCGMGNHLMHTLKSLDPSYQIFSQNNISNSINYTLLKELFPQQIAIIMHAIEENNIYGALIHYHVYFKETSYDQQKIDALVALEEIRVFLNNPSNQEILRLLQLTIKQNVISELLFHATCKHNVLWETGTILRFDKSTANIKSKFTRVVEVFSYYPPSLMIDEWHKKNSLAIAEKKAFNRRLLKQVLQSFFSSFKPAAHNQNPLLTLTRNEFDAIIEKGLAYIDNLPLEEIGENGLFTRTEFTKDELLTFKKNIYTQYNFSSNDKVFLVPAFNYTIALSCKSDCLETAKKIIFPPQNTTIEEGISID